MMADDADRVWQGDNRNAISRPTKPEHKPVPQAPDERPIPGPRGPRTPYPVDRPDIENLPGTEPDVVQPVTPPHPGRM
jgi:hypothetical protein